MVAVEIVEVEQVEGPVEAQSEPVPPDEHAVFPGGVDQFCTEIHPRLVGSLRLYTGDGELAAELAQEALVRVIERWGAVSAMAHPAAWTYRVAFNLARSRLRRVRAERRAHVRTGPAPASMPDGDLATAIVVRRAVALLPPRQRQAVVLRFYGGLSLAEVAEAMKCRPGTVKAHLHQAMAGLRVAGLADDDDVVAATGPPSRTTPPDPNPPRPEEMP